MTRKEAIYTVKKLRKYLALVEVEAKLREGDAERIARAMKEKLTPQKTLGLMKSTTILAVVRRP